MKTRAKFFSTSFSLYMISVYENILKQRLVISIDQTSQVGLISYGTLVVLMWKFLVQRRMIINLQDTAFKLYKIRGGNPSRIYNRTIRALKIFSQQLGVTELNINNTKWTLLGSIYYSVTVYTTIGKFISLTLWIKIAANSQF